NRATRKFSYFPADHGCGTGRNARGDGDLRHFQDQQRGGHMNKLSMAVTCVLALATTLRAQNSESAEGNTLEEVTVLADRAEAATKTDTALVEIPQSISVVTS